MFFLLKNLETIYSKSNKLLLTKIYGSFHYIASNFSDFLFLTNIDYLNASQARKGGILFMISTLDIAEKYQDILFHNVTVVNSYYFIRGLVTPNNFQKLKVPFSIDYEEFLADMRVFGELEIKFSNNSLNNRLSVS